MAHIFVSYAHNDTDFAKVLIGKLKDAGFASWRDAEKLRAGKDWGIAIDEAIHDSFALVVAMSFDAKHSEYVTYEWAYALGANIPVIPLILDKKMFDDGELHTRLARLQCIPFHTYFNLEPFWQQLIEELKRYEVEYQTLPKSKITANLSTQVQNAIDVLNNPQYFDTTDAAEISALHKAVNNLSPSKHPLAREALLAGLEHANPETRKVTAWVLGESRDMDAVPKLIDCIADIDLRVRNEAIAALAHIHDERCVPELIKAMSHRTWETRAAAAIALSNFPPNLSTSPLLHALNDKVGTVRAIAATSLGELGDARAIPALKKCSSDEDKSVRENASKALVKIRTSQTSVVAKQQYNSQNRPKPPATLKMTDSVKSSDILETPILPQIYPKLTQTMEDLLLDTEEFIQSLGSDIQFKQNQSYVAFKREPKNTNVAAILLSAKNISLVVKHNPDEIILEEGFTRVAHNFWGKDRFEIRLESKADLEKAKPLIIKSYELNG